MSIIRETCISITLNIFHLKFLITLSRPGDSICFMKNTQQCLNRAFPWNSLNRWCRGILKGQRQILRYIHPVQTNKFITFFFHIQNWLTFCFWCQTSCWHCATYFTIVISPNPHSSIIQWVLNWVHKWGN